LARLRQLRADADAFTCRNSRRVIVDDASRIITASHRLFIAAPWFGHFTVYTTQRLK
jgi:hypothetical protein